MSARIKAEEDVELVPVPMDRAMRERLCRIAKAMGKQPIHAAAQLLGDLLAEDELSEAESPSRAVH